jgi:hypothetical protein
MLSIFLLPVVARVVAQIYLEVITKQTLLVVVLVVF